ncbi:MAG TPA: PfkB family carbohydrate kinase [Candidatus Hydrogenedentes bacterium]|nr:PfkB family carbohydrate kinase [Candidatus Hydrogenedentota bacterium]HPG66630.1 PfkB family carbohydrate kinase [Candidatus Hydrogenedentota bacterium]
MKSCDLLVIGHVSKDFNIAPDAEERSIGGAVVYSSVAAKRAGAEVLALTKVAEADMPTLEIFGRHGVPVIGRPSSATTSIRNTYHTADRERRTCEALSIADPFSQADVPDDLDVGVYYLGGLIKGEFSESLVMALAELGPVAVDVQGFLRVSEGGAMSFRDWAEKRDVLPSIALLKTDAAEAEVLTGETDLERAAAMLRAWGAAEVMITHNDGVRVLSADGLAWAPFTARNLSGRTGRGDTCFASYCAWRRGHSPAAACRFAAALTSLKMETPGPFAGSVDDVLRAIDERYDA